MGNFQIHNPDLHMHSVFSDGTDTPGELIAKVRGAGIDLFSLTDHDCLDGCQAVRDLLQPTDPLFITGVELSCEDDAGKYHILGYGYAPEKPALRQVVDFTHAIREEKTQKRMAYLENLGFSFTQEEKEKLFSLQNPGKPHFAELLVRKGCVRDKAAAFSLISGYHGAEEKLTPRAAIDAIVRSDGIAVLAHGILADGSKCLSGDEIRTRVKRLKNMGLGGLECYYSAFYPEQQETMLKLAEDYNLLVTAGSDYHGSIKPVHLGRTGTPDYRRMEGFYRKLCLTSAL